MITTTNIQQRLQYIDEVIALYENERETLRILTTIYKNPVYKDIRDLEKFIDNGHKDQRAVVLTLSNNQEKKEAIEMKDNTERKPRKSKEIIPSNELNELRLKEFNKPCNIRIMSWMFENTISTNNGKHREVRLSTTPQNAKVIGVGSNTLQKFVNLLLDNKLMVKGKQAWRILTEELYTELEAAYAKTTPDVNEQDQEELVYEG